MKIKNIYLKTDRGILIDDKAVSPVIAVILMVAITVVMAAIVSSWSAGVKAPTTPTTVGLDIARDNDTISVVVTAVDPASSAPIPKINISYYNYSVPASQSVNLTNANAGDSMSFNTGSANIQQIIITATYRDSSKKVLFSREI